MYSGVQEASVSFCSSEGCPSPGQWQCAYVDSNRRRCESHWCQHHGTVVNGWVFCRRHATVAGAITRAAGTLREIKTVPSVGDRGMGLAVSIGTDLSAPMAALLQTCYETYPHAQIHGDDMVRSVWQDRHTLSGTAGVEDDPLVTKTWRELNWEWSWSVSTSAGFLKRIVLSVPGFDPPIVTIKVDGNRVFSGPPDWIVKRHGGEASHPSDRSVFVKRLMAEVARSVAPQWDSGTDAGESSLMLDDMALAPRPTTNR